MEMLETYYERNIKSNTKLKISEMTTTTYILKLKDTNLMSRKTLNS